MKQRVITACWRFVAAWLALAATIVMALPVWSGELAMPVKEWHHGLFRVNSDISSGTATVEEIATQAEAAGMDFVVFSDQLLVRAEYGLPPFRRTLRVAREQPSVIRYGVERYLGRLNRLQLEHPGLVVIPGVDVAPAFWWSGQPWRGNLTAHQFSQQLTVFGPGDAAFYRELPVMFNRRLGWRFPGSLLGLLPLLLSVLGWLWWRAPAPVYYEDRQGNSYSRPCRLRRVCGIIMLGGGILWTVENRPFSVGPAWSPHEPPGLAPFQAVCDHVREHGGDEAGVIWAHPEISMRQTVSGAQLVTMPYLDDVERTFGHNGLAGIYGDAFKAHLPGGPWDRLLLAYARGERQERPVVVGESDYHGQDRPLDCIQTVVRVAGLGRKAVLRALLSGQSYACFRQPERMLVLTEARVSAADGGSASLGEELEWDGTAQLGLEIAVNLEQKMAGKLPPTARLTLVIDGDLVVEKALDLPARQTFLVALSHDDLQLHYVRFQIEGDGGQIIANPIFVRKQEVPHESDAGHGSL